MNCYLRYATQILLMPIHALAFISLIIFSLFKSCGLYRKVIIIKY